MPANDPGNNIFDPYPFTRSNWKEVVSGMQPGGGDSFGIQESDAVLTGYVPWNMRFSFIRNVLGYSYVEDKKLRRVLPVFHPWYEWMAAYQVHLQARAPRSTNGVVEKINAPNPSIEFDFAAYKDINCLIRFRQQPWEWKPDSSSIKEYERYIYEMNSSGELQVYSQIRDTPPKYAEGPVDNPKGVEYPGEFPFYAYFETLRLKWMMVPKDYVCLENTFKKPKISAAVGRVNLTKFLGYERGELLLNPPQYERFEWPLRVVNQSAYGYNIELPFSVFTPPKGVADTPPGTSPYFGHDLVPWRMDGLWYLSTRGGGTGDPRLIPATEFADIFTHALA